MAKHYWLMKSEPGCYGIEHLAKEKNQTTSWDGVRNYQVRNMMRDQMRLGDRAFFYHSSCKEPGIVGEMEVVREGYPDHTAFDPEDEHYDPKSDPDSPRWFMVDLKLVRICDKIISLKELKQHSALEEMLILRRGNRLSVTSVTPEEWRFIDSLN